MQSSSESQSPWHASNAGDNGFHSTNCSSGLSAVGASLSTIEAGPVVTMGAVEGNGYSVGSFVGYSVGTVDGSAVGTAVGSFVGYSVGTVDGSAVGSVVGFSVGSVVVGSNMYSSDK